MGALDKLEDQLAIWLDKKSPIKIPPEGRKSLAHALWWIALVVGIIEIWGAWSLWQLGHVVDRVNRLYFNDYSPAAIHLGIFYWISFVFIALVGIIMLLAVPKLKAMNKSGWDLLFYSALVNALFAIFRLFSGVDGIATGFLGAALGTFIGAYLLFQTREQFNGKRSPSHGATGHGSK